MNSPGSNKSSKYSKSSLFCFNNLLKTTGTNSFKLQSVNDSQNTGPVFRCSFCPVIEVKESKNLIRSDKHDNITVMLTHKFMMK